MVRVIMGVKGTGKTKQMIDMINQAVQSEHGNVVCIEKGDKLRFDINYQIRLVDSSQYDVADYAAMRGFISGLYAGNYDITHVFIDSLTKIVPSDGYNETEDFLKWLNNFYRRFFTQQFKRSCLPDGPKVGSVTLSPRGDWRMPSDAVAALWMEELEGLQ